MALNGEFSDSHKYLFSVHRLIKRAATTPVQLEEMSIWNQYSGELDAVLTEYANEKKPKLSDTAAKVLYTMKAMNFVTFLSGEKKKHIVATRKKHTKSAMSVA
jgi:hypothetical protein